VTADLLAAGALALASFSHPAPAHVQVSVVAAHHAPRPVRAPAARHAYDAGHERGYRDGRRRGAHDARLHRRYDPERHQRFRDGDHGYRQRYGPRTASVSGYRRGFEKGYHGSYVRTAGFHPRHRGYCDRHPRARRR